MVHARNVGVQGNGAAGVASVAVPAYGAVTGSVGAARGGRPRVARQNSPRSKYSGMACVQPEILWPRGPDLWEANSAALGRELAGRRRAAGIVVACGSSASRAGWARTLSTPRARRPTKAEATARRRRRDSDGRSLGSSPPRAPPGPLRAARCPAPQRTGLALQPSGRRRAVCGRGAGQHRGAQTSTNSRAKSPGSSRRLGPTPACRPRGSVRAPARRARRGVRATASAATRRRRRQRSDSRRNGRASRAASAAVGPDGVDHHGREVAHGRRREAGEVDAAAAVVAAVEPVPGGLPDGVDRDRLLTASEPTRHESWSAAGTAVAAPARPAIGRRPPSAAAPRPTQCRRAASPPPSAGGQAGISSRSVRRAAGGCRR